MHLSTEAVRNYLSSQYLGSFIIKKGAMNSNGKPFFKILPVIQEKRYTLDAVYTQVVEPRW